MGVISSGLECLPVESGNDTVIVLPCDGSPHIQRTCGTDDSEVDEHQARNRCADARFCTATTVASPQDNRPVMYEERSSEWEHIRKEMHQAIDERDCIRVQHCLQSAPRLELWLHPSNTESTLHRAVRNDPFFIYRLLLSHNCQFMKETDRRCFRDLNRIQKPELQRHYFLARFQNSLSQSLSKHEDFGTRVARLLQEFNHVELLADISKAVSTSQHLKIRCDFEREDVQSMVGSRGRYSPGNTDRNKEEFFIAAEALRKGSASQPADAEVAGTIIHGMCHLAHHLVYRNGGKHYFSQTCTYLQYSILNIPLFLFVSALYFLGSLFLL
ncbi:uncharacterized protein LOC135391408 [Ornithodoros turicata]|uniref:uncharacterized protein LOC135391408 n=1 Tax=Ornithodoros turicata TaxID=34597 RepID=UPI003138B60D